jgi:hypothetical protein
MKSLVGLALLVCASAALAKAPPPAAPVPGTLAITSTTEGAEVFIDGERVGIVPLTGPLPLQPGEHTIKVQKAGFAPLIDVFKIQKKTQTKLEVELVPISGAVRVTSSVEKARVFIDGKFVCEAPCSSEMPVGPRAIQVSKGGYKDFFQNISSVAGQEVVLDVKLEELPAELNPYRVAPPPPARWYEKWWVWTAGVVALGAVVTAIAVPVAESQRDRVKDFGPTYTFTIGN